MKKVININFQGRVVPIEESAHDILKQYIESLTRFFAGEEGKDEIINDIEGRIAELFGDKLKKGSTCITEDDVNAIIASMGRPEDFEGEETNVKSQLGGEQKTYANAPKDEFVPRGRLYRNDTDKILGGVCGGIAAYLRIDPSLVRIILALLIFLGGSGFLLYILLWIILPSKKLEKTVNVKRLYRNPDEKVIAGVASGLAAYFNIAVWIPRLIFALPLVSAIITSIFRSAFWWDFDPFPQVLFGSFSGTLFIIYVVLWVVIPEAFSASEKLEMRGEKVDLNSIKNTIQEDLEGFKEKAEKYGKEIGEKAKDWGNNISSNVSQASTKFAAEASTVTRSSGRRIGSAIGILFKAFFLLIAGIIAFALLISLFALMFAGVGVFPLKDYFLEGFWQNAYAWGTLLFFLGVPVIGMVIWIARRVMGVKTGNKYLGWTFGGLWTIGWICGVLLISSITSNFRALARERKEVTIAQPVTGKVIVKVAESPVKVYGRWFNMDGVLSYTEDSLYLNNVRFRIRKSDDANYRMNTTVFSNGTDEAIAMKNVKSIRYNISQQDSLLVLDRGFALQRGTKFRNQGIVVTLQVPVGKKILIDRSVARRLHWFHINFDSEDWDNEWDNDWNNHESWSSNVEYIMTEKGLERTNKKSDEENSDEENDKVEKYKKSREELERELERKQKEAEELKKELNKPAPVTDSTKYKYRKTV